MNKKHAYKIVADENMLSVANIFSPLGSVKLMPGREITKQDLKGCELLLVRSVTNVNEDLLEGTPVKVVGSATAGLDHIDLAYLKSKGIFFADAKGANANAVAEYVIASLAALSKQYRENHFAKKIAVVGYGFVGKALVEKLKYLSANIYIYDPLLAGNPQGDDSVTRFCTWEDVLACDVISFHVPFVKMDFNDYPTENMIDSKFLSRIKKDVVLINAARGEICDEKALLDFLKINKDVKLIWDVWRKEPMISRLLLNSVFIGTFHIAGYSLQAKILANKILFGKIASYLNLELSAYSVFDDDNNTSKKVALDVGFFEQAIPSRDDFFSADYYKILETICMAYQPLEDCKKLMSLAALSEKDAGNYFDKLRKEYVHRHEWNHFLLNPDYYNEIQKLVLKSLGFSFGD